MTFFVFLLLSVAGCHAQWGPGDVMPTIEFDRINAALDSVINADIQNRMCAIGLANVGPHMLTNPAWHMFNGNIHSPLPYNVVEGETALILFMKFDGSLYGTEGVMTYDIVAQDRSLTDYKLAVMWSVPNQDNDNWFNTKIYPRSLELTDNLFRHMYDRAGSWRAGGYFGRTEFGVETLGTMVDYNLAKLIVWIDTSNFNETMGPSRYSTCRYRGILWGDYCEVECYPTGICWSGTQCNADSVCQASPQVCQDGQNCVQNDEEELDKSVEVETKKKSFGKF